MILEYVGPSGKRMSINLSLVAKAIEQESGCLLTYPTGHKEFVSLPYETIARALKAQTKDR